MIGKYEIVDAARRMSIASQVHVEKPFLDFIINRMFDYRIRVFHQQTTRLPLKVVIQNVNDDKDIDYVSLCRINLTDRKMQEFLKENIKIYNRSDQKIDYCEITHIDEVKEDLISIRVIVRLQAWWRMFKARK